MSELSEKKSTYEDLHSIPENMIGEIIDGELIATPRPAPGHMLSISILGGKIMPSYQYSEGGNPGGWVILFETEVKLEEDIVVPDLAGWKKERFPTELEHNWISVVPDWVCEVLSPSTFRNDKIKKMPLYGRHGVGHIWLIDPLTMTMDAFRLESGRWSLLGSFDEKDKVRVEPFEEVEINLKDLWVGSLRQSSH
jgi:Uma2 family endonuclease